jgi:hypothetical protein
MSETETLEGTAEEGQRLAEAAKDAGLPLLLVGGVAIWVTCPSARGEPLSRTYGDADFVGRASDRKKITAFMTDQAYEPDKLFNAIHGATRLNYHDPARDRPIDVLLDKFAMAHELDLRDALRDALRDGAGDADRLTLPLADLLLTKLQVVSINRKDLLDIAALLLDHGFGSEAGAISTARVLAVTKSDWGFEHTIHKTLATLREQIGEFGLPADAAATIVAHADELDAALNAAPKSMAWKMRARVGERVKWYEEPEEARG